MKERTILTKEDLMELIKNDPKYLEAQRKTEESKKRKERDKFVTQGIITEYSHGETTKVL